jgi:hypothetical protein
MYHMILTVCLVLNPTMCKPPVELVQADTGIMAATPTACMMGSVAFAVFRDGAEWYAKVRCVQAPGEFDAWLEDQKALARRR